MKIIAESAFNHNGDLNYLKELADASKNNGADFFTVQIFKTEAFCTRDYSKYQICKDAEISTEGWKEVFALCDKLDLKLIPCVLDDPSLDLAVNSGFKLIKLHATDLLNLPFIKKISRLDMKVLLETQCATKRDIDVAVGILGNKIEAIFHGFSNYPTENEDLNLNALDFIKQEYPDFKIGFADHSTDITEIPLMALAKNIDYFEKHITLDRNDRHYDWQVSLDPVEFSMMVSQINKYSRALGKSFKQPVKSEIKFRDIIYKKYVKNNGDFVVKRSDHGLDYYQYRLIDHDKNKIIATVIARLKSKRLPLKVFKKFHSDLLVYDLMKRVATSKHVDEVVLATSNLEEDKELITGAEIRSLRAYGGDPLSVIDRMIDLGEQEKAGAVFRITGDNPFTDPFLLDEMAELYLSHDLEYVRANNLPFGTTAELFSMSYLYRLYYNLENPYQTEYLTWFVMLDKSSKKGCIDFQHGNKNLKKIGFSVDHPEDLERCKDVLSRINKENYTEITLKEILTNLKFDDLLNLDSPVKLPGGKSFKYSEYLDEINNMNYIVRKSIGMEDLP